MLTKQEIFNRAYLGLQSQKWEKCLTGAGAQCCYVNSRNQRCAWGWVDTSLDEIQVGDLLSLYRRKIGLATTLDTELLNFAKQIQLLHDNAGATNSIKQEFETFARMYKLKIPEATTS